MGKMEKVNIYRLGEYPVVRSQKTVVSRKRHEVLPIPAGYSCKPMMLLLIDLVGWGPACHCEAGAVR